ncbi:hypothetical protein [Aquicella lusitana]|uniref:Uncharacterized protein n=1 Tax=Aquicella lusitana TaxID=254246 RepID=A0A370GI63_9COXI|nr:hypothetical protein [Aquicella lusitana]RDI42869.1 hypothetical protein C8D86_11267 [Aquicella lusitana]VVC73112.1 hypothetical protein AQULUS_08430 [Aquicella lusitana]
MQNKIPMSQLQKINILKQIKAIDLQLRKLENYSLPAELHLDTVYSYEEIITFLHAVKERSKENQELFEKVGNYLDTFFPAAQAHQNKKWMI